MNRSLVARRTLVALATLLACAGCRQDTESPAKAPPTNTASPADTASATNSASPTNSGEETETTKPWPILAHGPTASADPFAWDFIQRTGEEADEATILQSLGGGVGVLDFDLDGLPDVFFPGGGTLTEQRIEPVDHGLFQNLGDWEFVPVNTASQLSKARYYNHGSAITDFDSDGFPDILVTGYGGLQLYRNQGDGSFKEITATQSGLTDDAWSTSAAWGDLNNDGLPDLYVAHYVDWSFKNHPFCAKDLEPEVREICSPKRYAGLDDVLYWNQGDGTFISADESTGMVSGGKGLGVVAVDVDRDRDIDLYVANDTTENRLYLNDGTGRLEELGGLSGVAADDRGTPNGSMGVDAADYNQDGAFDLWVANYESESFALYRQSRGGTFTYVSSIAGIRAIESQFVGFGTAFVDLDSDGDEDLLVTNGHVILYPSRSPRKQLPLVLRNDAGQFHRLRWPQTHPLERPVEGRGLAVADFDLDGDPDWVVSHSNASPTWYENDIVPSSQSPQKWFQLRLVGLQSGRIPIGTTVELVTNTGQSHLRQLKGGGSYLSTSQLELSWGLPADQRPVTLRIHWLGSPSQEISLQPEWNQMTVIEPPVNSVIAISR